MDVENQSIVNEPARCPYRRPFLRLASEACDLNTKDSALDNRFRFITASGEEASLSGVPELVAAIASGSLSASTLLFDAARQRWASAAEHDAFRAAMVALPHTSTDSLVESTPTPMAPLGDEKPVVLNIAAHDGQLLSGGPASRTLEAELKALEDDFTAARVKGFDNQFLMGRYASERNRIQSEFGVALADGTPLRGDSKAHTNASTGSLAWRRYFARMVDLFIASFGFVIAVILYNAVSQVNGAPTYDLASINSIMIGIIISIFWVPFAAFALSQWGRTPGKALLGLRVQAVAADRIPYSTALNREAQVCFAGTALGIPLFALVTTWSSKRRLETKGRTSWDESLGLNVVRR